jgi:hypothetical protein
MGFLPVLSFHHHFHFTVTVGFGLSQNGFITVADVQDHLNLAYACAREQNFQFIKINL